jgi:PAS domain S-box-containing protein
MKFNKPGYNNLSLLFGFGLFNKYSKKPRVVDDIDPLINSLFDQFCLIDKYFNIINCNNAFLHNLAKNIDEVIGENFLSIQKIDPKLIWGKNLESAFSTGNSVAFEDVREGRTYMNSINPIGGDKGEILKAAIFSISTKKKINAYEKLRESDENYQSLFENLPIGISIISAEGRIIYANLMAIKLLGYEKRDISWLTTDHFYSNPTEKEIILKKIEHGHLVRNQEIMVKRKDGTELCILSTFTPITYSGNNAFIVIFDDITSRKASEEKILILTKAMDQSPISIIITDIEGKTEYVNEKFIETTGYNIINIIGKKPLDLLDADSSDEFFMKLWEVIGTAKEWKGELLNRFKNKKATWESVSISPIRNGSGEIKYYLAVKEDITKRKKIEQDLKSAKELAEQSNRLKDAFISNLSHEIRTPLNGLLGYASLLKELNLPNLTSEDKEIFDGINSTGKRLIRTMEMVLNYSRLEVGEYRWNFLRLDLSSLCVNLTQEFEEMAGSKQIELSFEDKSVDSYVTADEYSIMTAISNLIDNAIKYTNNGYVKLILYNSNNYVFLQVKDSGIGMSREFQDHIFEPYSQEDFGYSRTYEGLGLGLSLTKKLLSLNDASLSLSSEKNAGTVFTIKFNRTDPIN